MQCYQNFNISGNSSPFAEILLVSFRYIIRIQILMIFNLKKKKIVFLVQIWRPPVTPSAAGIFSLYESKRGGRQEWRHLIISLGVAAEREGSLSN